MAITGDSVGFEAAKSGSAADVVTSESLPDRVPDTARLAKICEAAANDIVVLIGEGDLPAIMVNALHGAFGPVTVIREQKQPTAMMIKRRMKLLGPVATIGQVGFGLLLKLIHRRSEARKSEIIAEKGMDPTLDPARVTVHNVESVNAATCKDLLQRLAPRVVVVVRP
ncbi:MAG: hypothetical protein AAGJ70_11230, partial [Pseudomonadota bacterium]